MKAFPRGSMAVAIASASFAGGGVASAAPGPGLPNAVPAAQASYSITGSGNNQANPAWGSTGVDLLRNAPAAYGDGVSTPGGSTRPSARQISNALSAQIGSTLNKRRWSDMFYVFGQFLDHDMSLTTTTRGPGQSFPVTVPAGDPFFDPTSTGNALIYMTRSSFDPSTGTSAPNPRQQINTLTAWIDGSQVYGSDATRAAALRTFSGGQMRTSAGNMLPFNTEGLPNSNDAHAVADSRLYLAGDVRANENPELIAIQTLFVREHNRIAARIAAKFPRMTDEQIFQAARSRVIGELQAITYNEYLPALLGRDAIAPYSGYKPNVNPGIANEFSTAGFRFGHSMLDSDIERLNDNGTPIPQGPAKLRDVFFNPGVFDPSLPNHQGDIDPFLKGSTTAVAQEIDLKVTDDVRNFLFGAPGAGGFDLAALNIQRGRDHGLADYNTVRAAYGLPKVTTFREVNPDRSVWSALQAQYGTVNNIDLWAGGLAEKHIPKGSLGPLFTKIIADQFTRLRDGDRLFYKNTFTGAELDQIDRSKLAKVIKDNTSLTTVRCALKSPRP